jgi:signal transduction histidine kinase
VDLQVKERTSVIENQKQELQSTLENLRQTQTRLIQSEKLAALGGLVAGVAHEINTPVGISVTEASSLAEETRQMAGKYKSGKISRTEFKDYLNTANQSAKLILDNMEKAATMVQSFKQVSVDQSTEQRRKFRLKQYSEDVIRSLYPRLTEKRINVFIDIDDKLELDSYPGAYSQVLTNLVLNSLVHGIDNQSGAKLNISAEVYRDQLRIEYSDNGKGIPEEVLPRIFDPFFTTDKKAGSGLGLHIVYNLVTQKLGGEIRCDSKPGEGARFTLLLPMIK